MESKDELVFVDFFFIQYPMLFAINITCNLSYVTNFNRKSSSRLKFSRKDYSKIPIFLLVSGPIDETMIKHGSAFVGLVLVALFIGLISNSLGLMCKYFIHWNLFFFHQPVVGVFQIPMT
jgi:hypothetical protein